MAREKGKKSNAQLIVSALMSGKPLKSRDIADMVSKAAGKTINVQDIASKLSKLSDHKRCDLGYVIQRTKEGTGFVYTIPEEVDGLTEQKAYDLSLKTGKGRYTLEQAVADFPGLAKYVDSDRLEKPPVTRIRKKPGRKPKAKVEAPVVKAKRGRKPKAAKAPEPAKAPAAAPRAAANPVKAVAEKITAKLVKGVSEAIDVNVNVTVTVKFEGLAG